MAGPDIADLALARAWQVYRLINREIDANDARRSALGRFIRMRFAAGAADVELLVVEGLKYLKRLEQSDPE